MIDPLLAIQDHSVREISILAATQMGKSLINDIALLWHIINRPLPAALIMQSNIIAEQHMESRLIPTMLGMDAIQDYLPTNKREMRKDGIYFPHMEFYVNGPGEKRLQSKTLGLLLLSELWQWPDGALEYARKRTKRFLEYGMSKIIAESQGGVEDSEWDRCFKLGTMKIWNTPCPDCKQHFIPDIGHLNCEGKKWNDATLGVKNKDGSYNFGKLEQMLTMECPHCHHLFKDSDKLKQYWADNGKYIQTNFNALKGHESFCWNSFAADPFIDIAYEFLEATRIFKKGSSKLLINFFNQRLARNVSLETMYRQNRVVKSDIDYNPKDKWDREVIRFMTVDTQENKFVVVVRAWAADGSSRLLWFGEAFSADELAEIQKLWGVLPSCVWIDTGGTRTREVYSHIIAYGWIGVKGVKEKKGFFKTYTDKKGRKSKAWHFWQKSDEGGDPAMGRPSQGKMGKAQFYLFCVNPIKDILIKLRDGLGVEWLALPSTEYDIKEYNKQMFSEFRKNTINQYGDKRQFWVKIKHDEPNDLWDCEVYQVGAALLHPAIDIKETMAAPLLSKNEENPSDGMDSDSFKSEIDEQID